jgi:hypothetical protein
MKWIKKGVIFTPDCKFEWMASHASLPVVDEARSGVLRVYYGARDGKGRSQTSYIEVDAAQPENVLYVHDQPILSLGRPGTFDDSGIMPSWIVNHQNKKYLYYMGWNVKVSVPYHVSIGLAVSEDGGRSFEKVSEGPLMDRSIEEPFFSTGPCVLREEERWRMWYASVTGWETTAERPEPRYNVKYAESNDGIHWRKTSHTCIDYTSETEAIGRPCVYKQHGTYKMLYSYRDLWDYRTDPGQSYRLGYANSADGLTWTRRDAEVGIERSASGWDSEMMEYCYVYCHQERTYLLYNGNGFGKTGIGYAVLSDTSDLTNEIQS